MSKEARRHSASAEGRDALRAAARELKALGYIVSIRQQLPGGQWITENEVFSRPQGQPDDLGKLTFPQVAPTTDYQSSVNQSSVNQALKSFKTYSKTKTSSSLSSVPPGQTKEEEAAPLKPQNKSRPAHPLPDAPPPLPVGDGVEQAKPSARSEADAMIARLPAVDRKPLTVVQRRQLASKASKLVEAGWTTETLYRELSTHLSGASGAGVFFARLSALPSAPPAAEVAGSTRPTKPPWCGHCDKRTRITENSAGTPCRCPDCHPLAAKSAQ
jgi:hypothetical protein